jgi:hypothetical protein
VLALEVGYGLIPLVDVEQDGELLERIKSIRRQIAQEIGIVVPSIHIQDNMKLKPGAYSILLKGHRGRQRRHDDQPSFGHEFGQCRCENQRHCHPGADLWTGGILDQTRRPVRMPMQKGIRWWIWPRL